MARPKIFLYGAKRSAWSDRRASSGPATRHMQLRLQKRQSPWHRPDLQFSRAQAPPRVSSCAAIDSFCFSPSPCKPRLIFHAPKAKPRLPKWRGGGGGEGGWDDSHIIYYENRRLKNCPKRGTHGEKIANVKCNTSAVIERKESGACAGCRDSGTTTVLSVCQSAEPVVVVMLPLQVGAKQK